MWQYGNRQNHFYQFRITLDYKKYYYLKLIKMKKIVSIFAISALFLSINANAQQSPKQKKQKAKTEKTCTAEEKKSCSAEEKKSCGAEKKAGCCSSKKAS